MLAPEKLKRYKTDFAKFARNCITVRNHNTAMLESLKFRPGQAVMHDVAEKRKEERGFLRILLLKNRRFGGSTYIGARGYHRASMNFNQSIFIIGHETDSTETLYKMVQLMQEKNPLEPKIKTSNAKELIFDNEAGTGLKSEYRLATAKNVEAGRSQGIHFAHNSEEAFWPSHADELLSSLFSCVPRPPTDTEIWRESTGQGYGNSFQKAVFKAWAEGENPYFTAPINQYANHMPLADMEFTFAYHDPDADWVLIFIPWFLDPSCQKQFESEDRKEAFIKRIDNPKGDINKDARKIHKKYGMTLEQLYWREWSIINECGEKVDMFNQENPTTIIDGFRTKGSNHYPSDFCDKVESRCLSPVIVGNIVRRMGAAVIEPNAKGNLRIWERYEPNEQYFMTVDAAGGKRDVHVKENREPDKTVIDVYNHRTGRQVAQWRGHVDYDLIDEIAEGLGDMYGRCRACVELNNHGYTVVAGLKTKKYPMYHHKPGEPGWSTNKKTKPELADGLLEGCREGVITIRCRETVSEMRTYVEVNGRYGGESGCNDDRVMTAQLAVQMMYKLPRVQTDGAVAEDDVGGVTEQSWMVA